jgi:hypothetical protein
MGKSFETIERKMMGKEVLPFLGELFEDFYNNDLRDWTSWKHPFCHRVVKVVIVGADSGYVVIEDIHCNQLLEFDLSNIFFKDKTKYFHPEYFKGENK